MIAMLLHSGADISINSIDLDNNTPLCLAVQVNNLRKTFYFDVTFCISPCLFYLLYCIVQNNRKDIVKLLIDHGACPSYGPLPPLVEAAEVL